MSGRVLVVVATPGEAGLLPDLPGARVVVSGIGPVNAALTTLEECLRKRPSLVLNAGVAGAMPGQGVAVGSVVVGSEAVAAGLGAEDGERFLGLQELGFPLHEAGGRSTFDRLAAWEGAGSLAVACGASLGPILTLETVTGSAATLSRTRTRYPDALAEAMEGAGAALAALRLGVPFIEVRGISNLVGPRDRASWRMREALDALAFALRDGWDAVRDGPRG